MKFTNIQGFWSLMVFCLLFLATGDLVGQDGQDEERIRSKRFRVYQYNGETYMYGELEDVDITARSPNVLQRRRGKRRLEKYTRLRWNIHKVYPYALKVSEVLDEVALEMEKMDSEDQKKEYLKSREADLFGKYENDVRKMSRSQGKVLVKLIYRQTGTSAYQLIKDTKSGASAMFWQSIGRIFGINLKMNYDTEEDMMIEDIVEDLENGGYNIYYKRYNYRLG